MQSLNQNVQYSQGNQALIRSTGTDGNFAYQAIIGAAFPIAAVPGLAATLDYRFVGVTDPQNYKGQYFAPGVTASTRIRETEAYNHTVMLGLRYAFNAAPPPVAGPGAGRRAGAGRARTYLVFFDWDRADLTDRARQIIAEAAQATTRVQVTRIEVSGHTDTTGTARYNQAPVGPPRAKRGGRAGAPRRAARGDHDPGLSATAVRWSRPGRACASRRTAGWRSSSANADADAAPSPRRGGERSFSAGAGQQFGIAAGRRRVDRHRLLGREPLQVVGAARLWPGSRQAVTAERLHPDHGPDHVAVDVDVAHRQALEHRSGRCLHARLHAERQPVAAAGDCIQQPLQLTAAPAHHVQDRAEHLAPRCSGPGSSNTCGPT